MFDREIPKAKHLQSYWKVKPIEIIRKKNNWQIKKLHHLSILVLFLKNNKTEIKQALAKYKQKKWHKKLKIINKSLS